LYYERLSLEIIASKFHWQTATPSTLTGRSGVTHRFDFVATGGQNTLVFDVCERLGETDVIKTYIKKLDTGASAYIYCPDGKISEGARRLASEYGLEVLCSDTIESAFRAKEIQPQEQSRRLAVA
jgi:hypothetical protein